jgi:hypothetical protein
MADRSKATLPAVGESFFGLRYHQGKWSKVNIMKTLSQTVDSSAIPAVISPSVVFLGLLAAGVLAVALIGKKLPLLSNLRLDLAILIVLGMAMCTQGGIGRVAALNAWGHPLAIVGYVLGAAILLVAGATFLNIRLPLIADDRQALLLVAGLIGAKVVNSVIHSLMTPR